MKLAEFLELCKQGEVFDKIENLVSPHCEDCPICARCKETGVPLCDIPQMLQKLGVEVE